MKIECSHCFALILYETWFVGATSWNWFLQYVWKGARKVSFWQVQQQQYKQKFIIH